MSERIRPNSDQVASKVMDGEAVLINLATGVYYSLTGSAGFIWSLVEQEADVAQISSLVASQYGQPIDEISADLEKFFGELASESLIQNTSGGASGDISIAPEFEGLDTYSAPALEKYTDMADMFALDPPLPGLADQGS